MFSPTSALLSDQGRVRHILRNVAPISPDRQLFDEFARQFPIVMLQLVNTGATLIDKLPRRLRISAGSSVKLQERKSIRRSSLYQERAPLVVICLDRSQADHVYSLGSVVRGQLSVVSKRGLRFPWWRPSQQL